MAPDVTLLVTGGAGFIGSAFIRYILDAAPSWRVINFDSLSYAGNLHNLDAVSANPSYQFHYGNITIKHDLEAAFSRWHPSMVVHFAAESHVDRGIGSPELFLRTNIGGTQLLLDCARKYAVQRFVHISTDEVYGAVLPPASCTEDSPMLPNNTYAASKAAADMLVRVAHQTWQMPVMTIRATNNYGPCQFPEKLIPLMIQRARNNQPLPVYGDGLQQRTWLHVDDHCRAIEAVLRRGEPGEIYNVGTRDCPTNLQVITTLLDIMAKPHSLITHVADRPGHDLRYALDYSKISRALGWQPHIDFATGLQHTVQWYLQHHQWLDDIASDEYHHYNKTHIQEGL